MMSESLCACRSSPRVSFVFFKQKTAYEITRWTGVQTCALPIYRPDVEMGDAGVAVGGDAVLDVALWAAQRRRLYQRVRDLGRRLVFVAREVEVLDLLGQIGRASCRGRV